MELYQLYASIGSDYEVVLARFCNNRALMKRFIKSFIDDSTFKALVKAVEEKHYKEIEGQAHTLKGVSANLGFDRLHSACEEVVVCIRKEKYEETEKVFQHVQDEYNRVIAEIRKVT